MVVPMHYKTDALNLFLERKANVRRETAADGRAQPRSRRVRRRRSWSSPTADGRRSSEQSALQGYESHVARELLANLSRVELVRRDDEIGAKRHCLCR